MVKQALNKAAKVRVLKGWKTQIFNTVAGVVPILGVVGSMASIPELQGIIPAQYWPIYTAAVVLINAVLRQITTTPVGQKF